MHTQLKIKHLLLIILLPLFAIQCKKEVQQKDLPCYATHSGFVCNINGEPFEIRAQDGCRSADIWYDRNTGNLSVSGTDCLAEVGEPKLLSIYLFGVFETKEYTPIWSVLLASPNINGLADLHDSTLFSKVTIDELVPDNYREDFTGGLVSGTFEFTLWNPTLNDTVYITDGSFCMPLF